MTAAITPLEARCEVCLGTGSTDTDFFGPLDCTHCSAADERVAMGKELGPMSQLAEIFAWRAYQLGKAAAAPVVPVAAQPAVASWRPTAIADEVLEEAASTATEMMGWDLDHDGEKDMQKFSCLLLASVAHLTAAPSLEAQPAGEVERDAARYRWLRAIGKEQLAVMSHYAGAELDKPIDAAIAMAQGDKEK